MAKFTDALTSAEMAREAALQAANQTYAEAFKLGDNQVAEVHFLRLAQLAFPEGFVELTPAGARYGTGTKTKLSETRPDTPEETDLVAQMLRTRMENGVVALHPKYRSNDYEIGRDPMDRDMLQSIFLSAIGNIGDTRDIDNSKDRLQIVGNAFTALVTNSHFSAEDRTAMGNSIGKKIVEKFTQMEVSLTQQGDRVATKLRTLQALKPLKKEIVLMRRNTRQGTGESR